MRHRSTRTLRLAFLAVASVTVLASPPLTPSSRAVPASPEPVPVPAEAPREAEAVPSAIRLFAAVEDAWSAADSDRLASLVDTTVVRISVTPGTAPTTALTRSAAAFLFQDPLRLVRTRSFRVVRVDVQKKGRAVGTALWTGDWGGSKGERDRQVVLTAMLRGNRWLLTEVRAND